MELSEALYTTRAMRRVSSDPIPADVVQSMLDAAIRSPSGGNSQNWRWVTVTDTETISQLGVLYAQGWEELNATLYKGKKEAAEASGDEATKRVLSFVSMARRQLPSGAARDLAVSPQRSVWRFRSTPLSGV